MYFPDVVSLKQFYASLLGRAVHTLIWRRLHVLWPEARGEVILGLGFAMPYFAEADQNVSVIAMPAAQGALYWPVHRSNRVVLSDETSLPFADGVFNRIVVVHALEHSNHAREFLQEMLRVLTPGGRVIVVVPSRMGLWSRGSKNPFGHGRPFNLTQIREVLSEAGFTFLRAHSSLFIPPVQWRWVIRLAPAIEMLGQIFFPLLGGVLLVEAEKQVYAAVREPVRARSAAPVPAYSAAPITS